MQKSYWCERTGGARGANAEAAGAYLACESMQTIRSFGEGGNAVVMMMLWQILRTTLARTVAASIFSVKSRQVVASFCLCFSLIWKIQAPETFSSMINGEDWFLFLFFFFTAKLRFLPSRVSLPREGVSLFFELRHLPCRSNTQWKEVERGRNFSFFILLRREIKNPFLFSSFLF